MLGALKVAMAVAAGNTLVLKAAEDAPLARCCESAEICGQFLPPGVLNLITGYGEECGASLARHPLVRKLSFTESTEVGREHDARRGGPHRARVTGAWRQRAALVLLRMPTTTARWTG